MDPFRLALSVEHADGSQERLAPDEPDGRDVLQSASFSTGAGGFGDFTAQLARDIVVDRLSKVDRFDTLRLYGAGDRTAWEGYDLAVPASKGDGSTIGISGIGWSASLGDDEGLAPLFVTRDLGLWAEPPLLRRIALGSVPYATDFTASADANSLAFDSITKKDVIAGSYVEMWATAPGASKFGAIAYHYDYVDPDVSVINVAIGATDDPTAATGETYAPVTGAGIQTLALTTARKYIYIQVVAAGFTGKANAMHATFSELALYGNTGLSTVAISGEAPGVRASDAINYGLANGASWLSRQITASTFAIPELGFGEGASVQDIIEAANAYEGFDYFVWEGPKFVFAPVGSTGTTWRVRTDEGAKLSDQGPQAADTWTRIVGIYQEPTGETRIVGPPSLSARCDYTDASLEITDPSNPAVAHGRDRIKRLNLSFPTTRAGAIQICATWLSDMATVEDQGSVSVTGWARDEGGIYVPAYMIRAGDSIIVEDVSQRPRRITDTSYDVDARTLTATLDSPPHTIDAYLARLEARTRT